MRIDKYLKVSRVIKRRTIANAACDAGRVSINGRPAKAGSAVNVGDIVEVGFAGGSVKFEVLSITESTKKSETGGMYRLIENVGNEE